MRPATGRQTTITASGITAGGRTHNTEQPYEGVRMLTTEETTHHTATTGTFDAASRLCTAWQWLETQRRTAPEGADVWDVRWQAQRSATYLTDLLHTLQAGEYRLSPLQLHGQGEDRKAVRSAQDALVLKWVALSIEGQLPLHPACEHVKGHGGGRQSVNRLHALLTGTAHEHAPEQTTEQTSKKTADHAWVCRTDIRGYYRNINKETLLNHVRQHVQDPVLRDLISQYLHYTVEDGGAFHTPEKGISRGCALSPLMGALHLYDMDEHFSRQKGIHYARYMDDIVILAKTRWSLRKHTKRLMQWFSEYGFEAHPDKTQIGRTKKGFDWMGAWLTHEGVTDIAPRAKANHREKVRRLYERLARVPDWLRHRRQQQVHARVSAYRKRWNIWAGSLVIAAVGILPATVIASATGVLSGLPTQIPADGQRGDILGNGTMTYYPYTLSKNTPGDVKPNVSGVGALGGYYNGDVVNGLPYFLISPSECPSIGVAIVGPFTITWRGVTATGSIPASTTIYAALNPVLPSIENHALGQGDVSALFNVQYALLTAPSDPSFKCTGYTKINNDLRVVLCTGTGCKITTAPNGISGVLYGSLNTPLVTEATQPTPPPPVLRPTCEFTNTGPINVVFPADIAPADINAVANSKVIAAAPNPIQLNIHCSGDMTGVQPFVRLQWTRSAPFKGSSLRIGVANEVSDDSNGILLSVSQKAKNDYGDCGVTPPGEDMCGAYKIDPTNGLTLWPVVFRNTNSSDKAKSGPHTVTGTMTVVVP